MQGKAAFRGHPLHLMTISFPIAFWSGTIVTDLAGTRTGDPFWFRMSVVLIVMGTVSGLVASVFGFVDYFTAPMSPRAKRIATLHAIGSVATLVVFPIALAFRIADHGSRDGIAWTIAGAIVLLFAGYWGSELVMKHGIGMPSPTAKPSESRIA